MVGLTQQLDLPKLTLYDSDFLDNDYNHDYFFDLDHHLISQNQTHLRRLQPQYCQLHNHY